MTLPRFTDVPEGNGPAPGAGVPGAGNAEDFKRLILPHIDGAYNLARFITRDEELCQDVVQDAMLSAYRALGQFRGGSERSWLFTIVRNCARSAVTNKRKFAALTVFEGNLPAEIAEEMHGTPDPGPTPEEDFATKSDVEHVRRAIEAMPEPFREVVVLRDLEELAFRCKGEGVGAFPKTT